MAWKGQSKGTPLGYQIFIWIMQYPGRYAGYFVLVFVAFYYFLMARKEVAASWYYYRQIHQLGVAKSLWNTYLGFYKLGQNLLDKVAIMGGLSRKFTFAFDGEEKIKALATANKGAVLMSAHIGSWEIAGHLLKRINVPVHVVMFDNEYQQIKQLIDHTTGDKYFQVIAIKEDFSHLIAIHRALKRREFICIHGDRFLERNKNKTALVEFMGQPARFPLGPFELVSRLNIPCLFVYGFKESLSHYQFYAFEPPANNPTAADILKAYVAVLEKMVRKYPTQWFNFYKFWKQ